MTSQIEHDPRPVLDALERLTGPLEPLAIDLWSLSDDPGLEQMITLRLGEGWAKLESDWNGTSIDTEYLRSVLELNSGLAPFCKLSLRPAGHLVLTAEMPFDDDLSGTNRIESFVFGFKQALKRGQEETVSSSDVAPADPKNMAENLARLDQNCDESGWTFEQKEGRFVSTLETNESYYQAVLVPRADGSTRLSVALSAEPSDSRACRFATAVLLLRACHAVRGVRSTFDAGDENYPYRLESAWENLPSPSDLGHAMAGLSLAAQLCGTEAQSLQQESIAKSFLSFQGLSLKKLSTTTSSH